MSTHHLRSMTGFGRAQADTPLGQFVVELRAVNNRFLDLSLFLPRELNVLETALRGLLKQAVARGKVDVRVRFTPGETRQPAVAINLPLATAYLEQLRRLQQAGAAGQLSIDTLAGLPGVIETAHTELDEQATWRELRAIVEQALDALNAERAREGRAIADDLSQAIAQLIALVDRIDQLKQSVVEKYRERLSARIAELLQKSNAQLEPGRLEQEVALFADRADINEELVRLRAHLDRFGQLLRNDDRDPTGKHLDFLTQEINREVNTIASKARDTPLTNLALEMKGLTERIREQIQNVE